MYSKFLLAIATAGILASCSEQNSSQQNIHSVMLVQPQNASSGAEKIISGTIEAAHEISFGFKTPGQIAKILVKEGDYVKAGQLLAIIDDKDYRLDVEATQIQHDQLAREVERLEKLNASRSISGNDYDKAKSGLAQLAVGLKAKKNQLEYCRLYAPTSGYIQAVNFEVSEMVNSGTPVFSLLDSKQMEVVCHIPASLYMAHKSITEFACKGRFSNGEWKKLRLISFTPMADANQLYTMRLALDSNNTNCISGQNVSVKINMDQSTTSIGTSIPAASVLNDAGKNFVMVYNPADSTVHRNQVEINNQVSNDGHITVTKGLNGSELIVKAGASRLADGEKVTVINN